MRWIFDLAWLALLAFMLGTWELLPATVGEGHKALPRGVHMSLMLAVAVFCPWLATRGGNWLARSFPAQLNMPNKAFWMADERREATLAWLRDHCFVLGLMLLMVFAALHYQGLQRAQPDWPAVPPPVWIVGGVNLVLGFVVWVVRLHRYFNRLPPPAVAPAPARHDASRSDELVMREVQPAGLLMLIMGLVVALLLVLGHSGVGDRPLPLGVAYGMCGLMAALVLVLGRLVVEVRGNSLRWQFGWLGRPRWQLALDEIVAVEPARSGWLEGHGIRITGEGMLYNAAGLQCVRLALRSGRRLRLGTQDPQRLIQALQPRIAAAAR